LFFCFFRLFLFFVSFRFFSKQFVSAVSYTVTESFDVSIEPKQTEDPPKQVKKEYIWVFLENLGLFRFVSVSYETVLFVSVVLI
jgi:hypothetical protein